MSISLTSMVSTHLRIRKVGRMDININSPRYYKDVYGVDNDVYKLCQDIHMFFKERQYSERIKVVGIVPIIAPAEYIRQEKYKEKKFCSLSYGFADVQLFVDYDSYVKGDIEKKKSLIVINTLKSIDAIKGKGKIDYKMFENDMRIFCVKYGIDIDL